MSNGIKGGYQVTFDRWLNHDPRMAQGFVEYFEGLPFNYDAGGRYELGRQLAVLAKLDGLRRSDLVRKKPKSPDYAFTKTKMARLSELAHLAGFFTQASEAKNFADSAN